VFLAPSSSWSRRLLTQNLPPWVYPSVGSRLNTDKGNNPHSCSCSNSADSFSSHVYAHGKGLFWNCICEGWFIFSLISNSIPSLNPRNVITNISALISPVYSLEQSQKSDFQHLTTKLDNKGIQLSKPDKFGPLDGFEGGFILSLKNKKI
jgi:hypothetical protein